VCAPCGPHSSPFLATRVVQGFPPRSSDPSTNICQLFSPSLSRKCPIFPPFASRPSGLGMDISRWSFNRLLTLFFFVMNLASPRPKYCSPQFFAGPGFGACTTEPHRRRPHPDFRWHLLSLHMASTNRQAQAFTSILLDTHPG